MKLSEQGFAVPGNTYFSTRYVLCKFNYRQT